MSKILVSSVVALVYLVVAFIPAPAPAQVCAPLDDGRVAEPFYEGTVIFWDPVVDYREMVLTISGPCEDIIKVFKKGEEISFDIREITKVTDGTYTWQLRRVSNIDPGVQEKLEGARGTGEEDAIWWNYFQKGAIPEGPYVESASFTVDRGVIVDPNQTEGKRAAVASRAGGALAGSALAAGLAPGSSDEAAGGNGLATRDQVIPDDLIVQGSACVGFDCVNNESFGFDTIRLKENNTRIQFNDTSVGSFPTGNWQIRANSSSSGGQSFLGFVDQGASGTTETGTLVFAVEAAARANALYVESDGDVGFGTSNPVLDLHISTANTPGIRLEQTSAGGFTAQTWDIAGNEANFFVRDVTGGSTLPFRIRPGAPSSSIDIAADGDVGIGTASPGTFDNGGDQAALHIRRTSASQSGLLIERATASAASDVLLELRNNGTPRFDMIDTSSGTEWRFEASGVGFNINDLADGGTAEFVVQPDGDVIIEGSLTVGPGGCTGCDLVFSPEYEVESIADHAAYMWANRHLPGVGPTPEDQPMNLSKKTGGILNELEKAHIYIEELHARLEAKEGQIEELAGENDALGERLTAIEAIVKSLPGER